MILLYCNGGAVVGNHLDTQNIPKSIYPSGTRVIPWVGTFGQLTKFGPAPPTSSDPNFPTPDTRPYAEPPPTKQTLLAYAAQLRYEKSVNGISFTAASGVIPVATDRESQMLLSNLSLYAQTLAPTAAMDFTQNNAHYAITASEAMAMFNAVTANVQNQRAIEAACIADLNSATPTILAYSDVEAKFA